MFLALCVVVGASCAPAPQRTVNTTVFIPVVINSALSWHAPAYADMLYGARLLYDGPPVDDPTLALTRAALHTNARLSPVAFGECHGASGAP
jgi:hypothetical protein